MNIDVYYKQLAIFKRWSRVWELVGAWFWVKYKICIRLILNTYKNRRRGNSVLSKLFHFLIFCLILIAFQNLVFFITEQIPTLKSFNFYFHLVLIPVSHLYICSSNSLSFHSICLDHSMNKSTAYSRFMFCLLVQLSLHMRNIL